MVQVIWSERETLLIAMCLDCKSDLEDKNPWRILVGNRIKK